MLTIQDTDFALQWDLYHRQLTMVRRHDLVSVLNAGASAPNPLLELLLPSMLHVQMMALVDDALELYLEQKGVLLTKPYRNDLNGRICYLADRGIALDAPNLHEVRKRRNAIGHDPTAHVSWAQLDADLLVVEQELQNLGFIGPRPAYSIAAERSALVPSNEPGVMGVWTYTITVTKDGIRAMEHKWSVKLMDDQSRS